MSKEINEIKVDIILPNYNSDSSLHETIDSVLNQAFKNWRLIIVDDNSNLNNKELLNKYSNHPKIEIIWLKKNKGPGFCRNIAMRYSKSDFMAFIDSDDIWYKDKLFKQLNFMLKNNLEFTYTNYLPFKTKNNLFEKHYYMNQVTPPKKFNFDTYIKNTSISTATMIIKNTLILAIVFGYLYFYRTITKTKKSIKETKEIIKEENKLDDKEKVKSLDEFLSDDEIDR